MRASGQTTTSPKLSARLSSDGLEVGHFYRVTSIDDLGVTFEEVTIDNPVTSSGVEQVGSLTVDWDRAHVMRDGDWYPLAPTVLRLLRLLSSHPGRVFAYPSIRSYVWGRDVPASTIAVLAKRLRYAVGNDTVETIRHSGLRLTDASTSLDGSHPA